MVTKKKLLPAHVWRWLAVGVVAVTAGCGPAGPRALLEGKRELERGKYDAAIEQLKVATSLMRTNANAWNYLGLAYHQAGHAGEALSAYQRALREDRDSALTVIHYNLGSLLLEQNKRDSLEAARSELTAFTLQQGNSLDGWLKLGTVQSRLGDLTAAEKSFNEARRIGPQNAEVLNDLGVIQMKRNRQREAAGFFTEAVKQQPNYSPALLNLALVAQGYLNNRPLALEKYHEYLALKPRPANWEAVNDAAQQLELELHPPARPATNMVAAANTATNNSNSTRVTQPPPQAPTNPPKIVIAQPPPKPVPAQTEPAARPDVVQVQNQAPVKSAQDAPVASGAPPTTAIPELDPDAPPPGLGVRQEKRGFLQKINPLNIFRHDSGAVPSPAPIPPMAMPERTNEPAATNAAGTRPPGALARYLYVSPPKPAAGNRARAEDFFAQAVQAQRDRRVSDAVKLYHAATESDPSFFEAQSNLGLAAYDAGDMPQSLLAHETALTIKPDSFSARFNFSLALKKAGYIQDAAQQLERLLVKNTQEPPARLAMVQLTLANLYAEQFHRPDYARPHYLKVLELDPQNSQATSIRYWLRDNP
jgi:tetratricopeptide (TPR) repeat protein